MSIIFDGVTIPENIANAISFNGVDITKVVFDGVDVWKQLLFSATWSGGSSVVGAESAGLVVSGSLMASTLYGSPSSQWLSVSTNGDFQNGLSTIEGGYAIANVWAGGYNYNSKPTSSKTMRWADSNSATDASNEATYTIGSGWTYPSNTTDCNFEVSGNMIRLKSNSGTGNWVELN